MCTLRSDCTKEGLQDNGKEVAKMTVIYFKEPLLRKVSLTKVQISKFKPLVQPATYQKVTTPQTNQTEAIKLYDESSHQLNHHQWNSLVHSYHPTTCDDTTANHTAFYEPPIPFKPMRCTLIASKIPLVTGRVWQPPCCCWMEPC